MGTPDEAVEELLSQVQAAFKGRSRGSQADAFLRVLAGLSIVPGDPAWTDGRDVIGRTYEFAIAGRERRRLGQYFTPMGLGGSLARWLLEAHPALVLDPGCGTGSLLMALAKVIDAAPPSSPIRSTRLQGLDVDPRMIAMAEVTAGIRRVEKLKVEVRDFLLGEVDETPDAIVCNPPYTRHHALSGSQKQEIHDGFQQRLRIDFSKLSSLHVLFLVRALEISSSHARLAFLTPANWLDMNYAGAVKKYLLERAHVHAIISFPATEMVFDHAITTAAITLIEKGVDPSTPTRFLHSRSSRPEDIQKVLDDPDAGSRVVLTSDRKWSRPTVKHLAGPRLEEVAVIRRGAATGYNEFFVLSEDDRRRLRIHPRHLVPCLPSPRLITVATVSSAFLDLLPTNVPRWLLAPQAPFPKFLDQYLQSGESEANKRVLIQQSVKAGRPWYQVELGVDAPIVMTYLNKGMPRFLRNQARAIPLNNWLTIRPRQGVTVPELLSALRRTSVTEALRSQSRIYGDGMWKLEPKELRALRLPKNSVRVPRP